MGGKSKIYIECHQGLGDHLICSGLYRKISQRASSLLIPVRGVYKSEVARLLFNIPQAKLISYPDFYFREMTVANGLILAQKNYEILKLGYFGQTYLQLADRFDEAFYVQAGVEFRERWDAFDYFRNQKREEELFLDLVNTKKKYVFLHDDPTRGFVIDKKYISQKFEIVRPNKRGASIFDYRLIFERAEEIHCIESSFSVLIDNLEVETEMKFIHRYARPEANQDMKHEASYKSNWNVLDRVTD